MYNLKRKNTTTTMKLFQQVWFPVAFLQLNDIYHKLKLKIKILNNNLVKYI